MGSKWAEKDEFPAQCHPRTPRWGKLRHGTAILPDPHVSFDPKLGPPKLVESEKEGLEPLPT